MIRRTKKIIKLRNPGWELDDVEKPHGYVSPRTVSDSIMINLKEIFYDNSEDIFKIFSHIRCMWNQGNYCFDEKDKPVYSYLCKCEKCDECDQNYCICPLLTEGDVYKTTWEFAKLVLDKQQLLDVIRWSSNEPLDKVKKDISNTKSLGKPSYPKYKKIAKELFRL